MPRMDLTGQKFGKLTALEVVGRDGPFAAWHCACECGTECVVRSRHLVSGHTKSCGCLHKPHGETNTRLHGIWIAMNKRCSCKTAKNYFYYGGRGIFVCDEWKNDYVSFKKWSIANGYQENLSIDRIDNDGPYSPENCRWSTPKEQSHNKRNSISWTFHGETRNISEWARIIGMTRNGLQDRVTKRNWTIEKALSTPVEKHKRNNQC